ncbi:MAG: hypothetical protein R3272_15670 [Candidatus Promineifilaceae bacterium]|nr:hypothetical protein [Candidatus Promineifilaceae bacterium]
MAQTIVALYDGIPTAHRAVEALHDAGFDRDQISLATPNPEEEGGVVLEAQEADEESPRSATATGAIAGGALGGLAGLLFGLAAFSIPGIGPILVAGPLWTAAIGAGVGGLSGGVLGALTEAGVPEEEAVFYREGVRRGYTLLAVAAEDDEAARRAAAVLDDYGPIDVQAEAEGWREEGWEPGAEIPDQYVPSEDDKSDQHKYAMGAMGEDLYGARADRDRPPLQPYDEDETE